MRQQGLLLTCDRCGKNVFISYSCVDRDFK